MARTERTRVWRAAAGFGLAVGLAGLTLPALAQEPSDPSDPPAPDVEVVLSGEDNRLNAYDARTGEKATVVPSEADAPGQGLDINAEICIIPDGTPWKPDGELWFIAGEDTEQNSEPGVIKQGWGIFRLTGTTLDTLAATQIAKLVPESFVTSADNPENYGCGVLPDGRIVTGDVGDQLPQSPATGQLIVWFIEASHIGPAIGPDRNDFTPVPHCKIDVAIGTAGGIELLEGDVLIASNRPDLQGAESGGVLRFDTALWPTGNTPSAGCGRTDSTGAPLADADKVGRSLFIPQVVGLVVTPSDIVHSGRGTLYVSSVFTGQVAEYSTAGVFQRFVVNTAGQLGGITPFGLTVTSDGALWVADIGIVGPGPVPDGGSVVRVPFDAAGNPGEPEVIDENLQFPDGLGAAVIVAGASPVPEPGPTPVPTPAADGGADRGATDTLPATGRGAPGPVAGLALGLAVAVGLAGRRLATHR